MAENEKVVERPISDTVLLDVKRIAKFMGIQLLKLSQDAGRLAMEHKAMVGILKEHGIDWNTSELNPSNLDDVQRLDADIESLKQTIMEAQEGQHGTE